ncbi:MAG: metallopeptidase family protein [Oscillospiraceae bacterium]|nr:metallopeptidase family protein [Oscillospiraceae bacterium]
MLLTIDEVNDLLDKIADELPEELFDGLNGGVCLLEEECRSDVPGTEDMYVMGHYCRDMLGNYINLYYGSFAALYRHAPPRKWERELRKTLLHELTHHMEGRANMRDLEVRDEQDVERYLAERAENTYTVPVRRRRRSREKQE